MISFEAINILFRMIAEYEQYGCKINFYQNDEGRNYTTFEPKKSILNIHTGKDVKEENLGMVFYAMGSMKGRVNLNHRVRWSNIQTKPCSLYGSILLSREYPGVKRYLKAHANAIEEIDLYGVFIKTIYGVDPFENHETQIYKEKLQSFGYDQEKIRNIFSLILDARSALKYGFYSEGEELGIYNRFLEFFKSTESSQTFDVKKRRPLEGQVPFCASTRGWNFEQTEKQDIQKHRTFYKILNLDHFVDPNYKDVGVPLNFEKATVMLSYAPFQRRTLNRMVESKVRELQKHFDTRKYWKKVDKIERTQMGSMLDSKKLYAHPFSHQIFKSRTDSFEEAPKHIHLSVDFSTSMLEGDKIRKAIFEILVLKEFCKRNDIPFNAHGFGCSNEQNESRVPPNATNHIILNPKYIEYPLFSEDVSEKKNHGMELILKAMFVSHEIGDFWSPFEFSSSPILDSFLVETRTEELFDVPSLLVFLTDHETQGLTFTNGNDVHVREHSDGVTLIHSETQEHFEESIDSVGALMKNSLPDHVDVIGFSYSTENVPEFYDYHFGSTDKLQMGYWLIQDFLT